MVTGQCTHGRKCGEELNLASFKLLVNCQMFCHIHCPVVYCTTSMHILVVILFSAASQSSGYWQPSHSKESHTIPLLSFQYNGKDTTYFRVSRKQNSNAILPHTVDSDFHEWWQTLVLYPTLSAAGIIFPAFWGVQKDIQAPNHCTVLIWHGPIRPFVTPFVVT